MASPKVFRIPAIIAVVLLVFISAALFRPDHYLQGRVRILQNEAARQERERLRAQGVILPSEEEVAEARKDEQAANGMGGLIKSEEKWKEGKPEEVVKMVEDLLREGLPSTGDAEQDAEHVKEFIDKWKQEHEDPRTEEEIRADQERLRAYIEKGAIAAEKYNASAQISDEHIVSDEEILAALIAEEAAEAEKGQH